MRIVYTVTAGGVVFANPPPGTPAGTGALVNVAPSGTCSTFSVKVEVLAQPPGGGPYVAANTFKETALPVGKSVSSYTGAFYWVP
jgi:hypothetical protein